MKRRMETRMTASSTSDDPVVIVAAARTPLGGFQGNFASLTAPVLGAHAIRAAVQRAGLQPDAVDEVLMGCVLPAGLGQAPARQASLGAGLPLSAGCTTNNKGCGSGGKGGGLPPEPPPPGGQRGNVAGGMGTLSKPAAPLA